MTEDMKDLARKFGVYDDMSRRELLRRAAQLGMSGALIGPLLAACGGSSGSQTAPITSGKATATSVAAPTAKAAASPASASPASGAGAATGQKLSGEVVSGIFGGNWETAYRQNMAEPFMKQHPDVRVSIDLTSPVERFAKLRAAKGQNPPYDLFAINDEFIDALMKEDLIDPFTADEVPMVKELYEISTPQKWQKNGKYYSVHQNWGQLGITYRSDKVQNPPKEWLDLWKPEYKGLVAISPLTYSAGLQFFIATLRALGGQEKNAGDVDKTFDKLKELKPNVVQTPADAGAIQNLLERGEIGLVPLWDGRAFGLADSGLPIGFSYPNNPGPVASGAAFAIAKGTKNRAAALALLDFDLSPEPQKGFCQFMWYAPSNRNVKLDEKHAAKVAYGDEPYRKLLQLDYDTVTKKLAEWQQRWTQTFS